MRPKFVGSPSSVAGLSSFASAMAVQIKQVGSRDPIQRVPIGAVYPELRFDGCRPDNTAYYRHCLLLFLFVLGYTCLMPQS